MTHRAGRWACLLLLLAFAVPAGARVWQVDAAHSTLTVTVAAQPSASVLRFRRFDARIVYDARDVARSKFDVVVDVASLTGDDAARVSFALGARFLDAAAFPRAWFATTRFRKTGAGQVVAEGELKLRAVIRPVVLAVTFVPHGDTATLDVTAQIDPSDFGIGGAAPGSAMGADGLIVRGHLRLRAAP